MNSYFKNITHLTSLLYAKRLNKTTSNMNEKLSYHYYHPNQLLVVNSVGLIRILYTPFRVLCGAAIYRIPQNTWVYVEEVYSNEKDELQYLIYGSVYSYKHFTIPIQF
jgi:hypothetical protein